MGLGLGLGKMMMRICEEGCEGKKDVYENQRHYSKFLILTTIQKRNRKILFNL